MFSVNDFYTYKNENDSTFERFFRHKMNKICEKFTTLSNQRTYRMIKKVQFITKTKNDTNIVHILNKLSDVSYDQIKIKLFLKLESTNAISFAEQILKYSTYSKLNSLYLHNLLNSIVQTYPNHQAVMINLYDNYISELLLAFCANKSHNSEDTDYIRFIKQNEENLRVKSRFSFIIELMFDTNCYYNTFDDRKYSIEFVHSTLSTQLCDLLQDVGKNDNSINTLLECIYAISVKGISVKTCKQMTTEFVKKIRTIGDEIKLPNKLRFKILDIVELLD
jgi:hypothetical protein